MLALFTLAVAAAAPQVVSVQTTAPWTVMRVDFDVGYRDDGGNPGLTALTAETVLFSNSRLNPTALLNAVRTSGGSLDVNAGLDVTSYVLQAPSAAFPALATQLLKGILNARLIAAGFDQARERFREVARAGDRTLVHALAAAMVSSDSYDDLRMLDPDAADSIDGATVDQHQIRFFRPANATVVIVGNAGAAAKTARGFTGGRRATHAPPTLERNVAFQVPLPLDLHATLVPVEDAPAELARAALLAEVLNARLHDALRREGATYTASSFVLETSWATGVIISVPLHPDNAHAGLKLLEQELGALANDGVQADELERARAQLRTAMLEEQVDAAQRAARLARRPTFDARALLIDADATTLDLFKSWVKNRLSSANRSSVTFSRRLWLDSLRSRRRP